MKEYTFNLKSKDDSSCHDTVVIADTYANAINQISFFIRIGYVIEYFTTRPIKYKYVVTITDVTLEHQGEWDFTFNDTHIIWSATELTADELDDRIKNLYVDIQSDTDEPYEDGYTIADYYVHRVELYPEGGE